MGKAPLPWFNFILLFYYWNVTNIIKLHFLSPQVFSFILPVLSPCTTREWGAEGSEWVAVWLLGRESRPTHHNSIESLLIHPFSTALLLKWVNARTRTHLTFLWKLGKFHSIEIAFNYSFERKKKIFTQKNNKFCP